MCEKMFNRLPVWPYMKLLFCVWLVLPIFKGAAYLYENLVRKYVMIGTHLSSKYPEQRQALQMLTLDTRESVERYMDKHGTEAFERIVKAVSRRDVHAWHMD